MPVVLGELRHGFLGGTQSKGNVSILLGFLAEPSVSGVDVATVTAERYALIKRFLQTAGTLRSANDIWIAASAMQHGLHVITTDSDFEAIPQIASTRFRV